MRVSLLMRYLFLPGIYYPITFFAVGLGGYMSLATAELLVQITILSRMLCQPPKNSHFVL